MWVLEICHSNVFIDNQLKHKTKMKKVILGIGAILVLSISVNAQSRNPHAPQNGQNKIPASFAIKEIRNTIIATDYNALGMPDKTDTAVAFAMRSTDNLRSDSLGAATFSYIFLNRKGAKLGEMDNVVMSGADYEKWDGENETAFAWVAKKLGVTLK